MSPPQSTQKPTLQVSSAQDARLRSLGTVLELELRARRAPDLQALGFIVVNETHALLPYRQAVLWRASAAGTGSVAALSGLAAPDAEAPFVTWVTRVCAHLAAQPEVRAVTAADLPEELAADWALWLPAHALWLPLGGLKTPGWGGLLLARDVAAADIDIRLLGYLADAYGHALAAQTGLRRRLLESWSVTRRRVWAVALVLTAAILLFPVHQATVAPAEVVARDPVLVRAPMDGVVDTIDVLPNAMVEAGQPLLTLDRTRIAGRLEVAQKALEIADAEYRQAGQQALYDARANASLQILQSRREQHVAEVAYLEDLLGRVTVRAPRAGIAIFDNVNEWLGRPVAVGERIIEIADPLVTEVEVLVPVRDAIALPDGARVRLFLNVDPHRPREATVRYASYQAVQTPDGVLAYRLLATPVAGGRPLSVGQKGTAKVYGHRTILVLQLLRRPFATVRQTLGL